jgi:hypothetical protein
VAADRREDLGGRGPDVLDAGLDVAGDLSQPADHAVQALGQSAQVLAAVGRDRGAEVALGDPGRELGVVAHGALKRLV